MASRYLVIAQSISDSQYADLRESLKGVTFLTNDVANRPKSLDVILLPEHTMEELSDALPILNECEIIPITQ